MTALQERWCRSEGVIVSVWSQNFERLVYSGYLFIIPALASRGALNPPSSLRLVGDKDQISINIKMKLELLNKCMHSVVYQNIINERNTPLEQL